MANNIQRYCHMVDPTVPLMKPDANGPWCKFSDVEPMVTGADDLADAAMCVWEHVLECVGGVKNPSESDSVERRYWLFHKTNLGASTLRWNMLKVAAKIESAYRTLSEEDRDEVAPFDWFLVPEVINQLISEAVFNTFGPWNFQIWEVPQEKYNEQVQALVQMQRLARGPSE